MVQTDRTIHGFTDLPDIFDRGFDLTVDAKVERGKPDAYGVSLYLPHGGSLYLSIAESGSAIWLERELSEAVQLPNRPEILYNVPLHDIQASAWQSIDMTVKPEGIEVQLNGEPILEYPIQNLYVSKVGVFVRSNGDKGDLPEVHFRDFRAVCFP